MTDAEIKRMAGRFLNWKLPADFAPDGGIIFVPMYRGPSGAEFRREPVGTNLFTQAQAEEMVRHMLSAD